MKFYKIFIIILYSCNVIAQSNNVIPIRDTCLFRIHVGFNVAGGRLRATTQGDLTPTQNFLFSKINKGLFNLALPDVQFILKDKIGINAGFLFFQNSTDSKTLEAGYKETEPYYYTTIANASYESGSSPLMDRYNFTFVKCGLMGFLRPCRNMVVLPFVNALFLVEGTYPELKINYKEPNSNYMFERTFYTESVNAKGINVGFSSRVYLSGNPRARKTSSIYAETTIGFNYIQTTGNTFYKDKDLYGDEIVNSGTAIRKDFKTLYIGIGFGGDLHKLARKNVKQ